ncbi:MAG TPA: response regulator [Roseiflexaceae bacterium]|nr:response regulator [Roseiflexaceae bacterium]
MAGVLRRPTVMVIDDDPPVRDLLCDLFLDAGYEVVRAEDGRNALTKLGMITPDVITLDLEMPGLNGAQVLSIIRQRMRAFPLSIVVISALDPIPATVRNEVQAVVPKPFDIAAVLDVIERVLPHPYTPRSA